MPGARKKRAAVQVRGPSRVSWWAQLDSNQQPWDYERPFGNPQGVPTGATMSLAGTPPRCYAILDVPSCLAASHRECIPWPPLWPPLRRAVVYAGVLTFDTASSKSQRVPTAQSAIVSARSSMSAGVHSSLLRATSAMSQLGTSFL